MFVLRFYFFFLSKIIQIKICSGRKVETAERECGGTALGDKIPTVVLDCIALAGPVGERMGWDSLILLLQ